MDAAAAKIDVCTNIASGSMWFDTGVGTTTAPAAIVGPERSAGIAAFLCDRGDMDDVALEEGDAPPIELETGGGAPNDLPPALPPDRAASAGFAAKRTHAAAPTAIPLKIRVTCIGLPSSSCAPVPFKLFCFRHASKEFSPVHLAKMRPPTLERPLGRRCRALGATPLPRTV